MENNTGIKERLEIIQNKIRSSAIEAGRNPEDIILIAVSKTVMPDRIQEAVDAGMRDLGENRVQEILEKYDKIKGPVNWHLIGHLQTNKVKYIIDKVKMIHSLDRMELAKEIQKRAQSADLIMDVLVQVNVAGEESKFGMPPEEADSFIEQVRNFPNIRVKGLMTIAPISEDPENIGYVFENLSKLFIDIKRKNHDNIDMKYLSMGMSNDFEVAIRKGSNVVRIGTAIFGKR